MMLAEDRLNEWYSTCYLMRYVVICSRSTSFSNNGKNVRIVDSQYVIIA